MIMWILILMKFLTRTTLKKISTRFKFFLAFFYFQRENNVFLESKSDHERVERVHAGVLSKKSFLLVAKSVNGICAPN